MFLVYKITNRVNGKIYIGITAHSFKHRWQEHVNAALSVRDEYVFHKALRKYGENAFDKEILFTGLSKEDAQLKERELIAKYNTYYLNGEGYNMTYGGECNDHKKGELNYGAKITNNQAAEIRLLLRDCSLTYSDILLRLDLEATNNNRVMVARINRGVSYYDEKELYPIRTDGRTTEGPRRKGEKNPAAKLNNKKVLDIIKELEEGKLTQTALAKKYNVTYNTINLINRCLIWSDLHPYRKNIRLEHKQKGEN